MIVIIGCGFLGSYLLKEITAKTNEKVIATVRNKKERHLVPGVEYICLDLTNSYALNHFADKCNGEEITVFYLASCHDIDFVYENPKEAEKVNVYALKNFIDIVPNIKKLFYASTDCVYGEGKYKNYKFNEKSETKPVNEYGRQKKQAEKIVRDKGFTVLRFPYMLGASLIEKKHFYDNILLKLSSGDNIELIDGMKRSVISYSQAAEFMYVLSLLESTPSIINVCADEVIGKYDIGCAIAHRNNISSERVIRISETDGEKFFKDKRASIVDMDNKLLKELLKVDMIKWEEALC